MVASRNTALRALLVSLATTALLTGCGSRSDYETLWMRELIGRGDAAAALAYYPKLPEELKQTGEVRELLLAARLADMGVPIEGIVLKLGPMLSDPVGVLRVLPRNALPEAQLVELVELALASPTVAASRESFFFLSASAALLGSLSLCKNGGASGPALLVRTCEYIGAKEGVKYLEFTRASRAILAQLDSLGEDRITAAAAMFGGGR